MLAICTMKRQLLILISHSFTFQSALFRRADNSNIQLDLQSFESIEIPDDLNCEFKKRKLVAFHLAVWSCLCFHYLLCCIMIIPERQQTAWWWCYVMLQYVSVSFIIAINLRNSQLKNDVLHKINVVVVDNRVNQPSVTNVGEQNNPLFQLAVHCPPAFQPQSWCTAPATEHYYKDLWVRGQPKVLTCNLLQVSYVFNWRNSVERHMIDCPHSHGLNKLVRHCHG